jgi:hypothetical protein
VPELVSLRLEILFVVRIWGDFDGDFLDDFKLVPIETNYLSGVVGHETNFAHAKIVKNLGSHAVIAKVRTESKPLISLNRIEALFLQFVGTYFVSESDATPFLSHVNENAFSGGLDLGKGTVQLATTVAATRAENITGKALAVDSNEGGFSGVNVTFYKC